MCTNTTSIAIVLADMEPQQQKTIQDLLHRALQKRVDGSICIVPAACRDKNPEEIVQAIIKSLEQSGLIPVIDTDTVYSDAEEEKVRKRLEDLGYL